MRRTSSPIQTDQIYNDTAVMSFLSFSLSFYKYIICNEDAADADDIFSSLILSVRLHSSVQENIDLFMNIATIHIYIYLGEKEKKKKMK